MIGLREDRRMAVRLISRINALFPVARPVEESFPCGKGACPVARGLVPRWAAQQPQAFKQHAVYQAFLSGWFWGCCAAQRGTSPLATGQAPPQDKHSSAQDKPFYRESLIPQSCPMNQAGGWVACIEGR
ncbi:hypothetical protein SAMN05216202_5128 [Pseudomonas mucidolens]|uniref:Uncharacterized protein n=1 Tax=Pseudomonas mucidolens TaxID=46679 RepID=A0A1H2NZN0_9PSED|nr:hypothetical protein SAMN05216202_5128 [Pseudomonas mucidolens]SQH36871.1 Uncharacterised protein [Pseudomonas mucidolens]